MSTLFLRLALSGVMFPTLHTLRYAKIDHSLDIPKHVGPVVFTRCKELHDTIKGRLGPEVANLLSSKTFRDRFREHLSERKCVNSIHVTAAATLDGAFIRCKDQCDLSNREQLNPELQLLRDYGGLLFWIEVNATTLDGFGAFAKKYYNDRQAHDANQVRDAERKRLELEEKKNIQDLVDSHLRMTELLKEQKRVDELKKSVDASIAELQHKIEAITKCLRENAAQLVAHT
jgi:hypothetical protein